MRQNSFIRKNWLNYAEISGGQWDFEPRCDETFEEIQQADMRLYQHLCMSYHNTDLRYYIVITIVERDTGKYHKFIAEYCYEPHPLETKKKSISNVAS